MPLRGQRHVLGEHEEHVQGSTGDTLGGRGGAGPEGTLRCVLTALEQRPHPEEPPSGQALGQGALLPQTDLPVCGQAGPRVQCRGCTASSLFHAWQHLGGCGQTQSCCGWRTQPKGTPACCYYYWCHPVQLRASLHYFLWRRRWHPTPVVLSGKSHGRRSMVGCRLWGRTESDTTEAN